MLDVLDTRNHKSTNLRIEYAMPVIYSNDGQLYV